MTTPKGTSVSSHRSEGAAALHEPGSFRASTSTEAGVDILSVRTSKVPFFKVRGSLAVAPSPAERES